MTFKKHTDSIPQNTSIIFSHIHTTRKIACVARDRCAECGVLFTHPFRVGGLVAVAAAYHDVGSINQFSWPPCRAVIRRTRAQMMRVWVGALLVSCCFSKRFSTVGVGASEGLCLRVRLVSCSSAFSSCSAIHAPLFFGCKDISPTSTPIPA